MEMTWGYAFFVQHILLRQRYCYEEVKIYEFKVFWNNLELLCHLIMPNNVNNNLPKMHGMNENVYRPIILYTLVWSIGQGDVVI